MNNLGPLYAAEIWLTILFKDNALALSSCKLSIFFMLCGKRKFSPFTDKPCPEK